MAIKKLITLDNGIPVNYHRVVSINKITNNSNVIEIASYVSEEKRQEELDYYNSNDENKLMNVYINTEYISKDYNETETIEDVYNYLKTTEKFKDAKDV
jgi:hypothetical protein